MYFIFYKTQNSGSQDPRAVHLGADTGAEVAIFERRPLLQPRKLFKIGEVMKYSGLSRQTVHNYTIWGLISEAERTESDHRLYGEEVFERIRRINELKKAKHTLHEIRQILAAE